MNSFNTCILFEFLDCIGGIELSKNHSFTTIYSTPTLLHSASIDSGAIPPEVMEQCIQRSWVSLSMITNITYP
ncbi:MAG: hypothetical protein ACRCZB_00820 [Bacteroidales bacterium]